MCWLWLYHDRGKEGYVFLICSSFGCDHKDLQYCLCSGWVIFFFSALQRLTCMLMHVDCIFFLIPNVTYEIQLIVRTGRSFWYKVKALTSQYESVNLFYAERPASPPWHWWLMGLGWFRYFLCIVGVNCLPYMFKEGRNMLSLTVHTQYNSSVQWL